MYNLNQENDILRANFNSLEFKIEVMFTDEKKTNI